MFYSIREIFNFLIFIPKKQKRLILDKFFQKNRI